VSLLEDDKAEDVEEKEEEDKDEHRSKEKMTNGKGEIEMFRRCVLLLLGG
jgi:hypothetical protein